MGTGTLESGKIITMKKIFAILLLIVVCADCQKNDSPAPIDSDLLANFNYQPGTYLIYKDSISGMEDSFFVTGNEGGTTAGFHGQVEARGITIRAFNINNIAGSDTENWYHTLIQNYFVTKWANQALIDRNIFIEYQMLFTYPFSIGYLVPPGSLGADSGAQTIQIIPNFSLNGKNYSSVAIVFQNGGTDYHDLFYINADAGIIKMDLNNSYLHIRKVWELERWKIVK